MNLDQLAAWRGFELRRGRRDPSRLWLVLDGQLFTRAAGTDEETIRTILAPANPRPRAAV
ncbi:hypothetical protein ASG90_20530 [Nocardioides sp. Soil797]|nr:hypothetical protein ASG90_20530 [Nocardioides sp. Soil797]